MGQPDPPTVHVVDEVPAQETGRSEFTPLLDMNQLVGQQPEIVFLASTDQYEPAQRHRRHARREERHDHDPYPVLIDGGDEGQHRSRRGRETRHHPNPVSRRRS